MAILWGGAGADTLTGGAEDNSIGGGGGNDRLTGNSARDQIFGGDGDDTITGGAGDDYLEGGAGRDSFVLRPGDGWDYIGDFQAGAGGDVLDLTAWTGITDVNALLALATSDGNDTILTFGPTASVRLAGVAKSALTADNVVLAAGSGTPGGTPGGGTPAGGTPGQALTGSAARDELYGTAGDDTITGGAGNDYMEGGAGSDRFVINAGDGWDAIGDFQAGTGGDVLDLSGWSGLGGFGALIASATEDGGGTVLNLSNDTGVRLMGVTKASLTAANIRLADGPANQPPVAQGQVLTTDEDRSLSGRLTATDPDSGSSGLSYRLVDGGAPQHGAVTINEDGSFTYTPGKDYVGADRFTFQVTDAGGLSSTESVELTVNRQRDDATAYFTVGGAIHRVSLDQPGATPEAMTAFNAQAGSGGFKQLAVVDGTLFATTSNKTIRAFDLDNPADTGRELAMPGRMSVSSDGKLYSFDGLKLYSYDPAQPGNDPALVADVGSWRTSHGYPLGLPAPEVPFIVSGNTLFFSASPVVYLGTEPELCRLDLGTPGAEPVRTDLFPGTYFREYFYGVLDTPNAGKPTFFTEANGSVYFAASTEWTGNELMRIDAGNPMGDATLVKDLYEGWTEERWAHYGRSPYPSAWYTTIKTNDGAPQNLTEAGGDLFFTASTPDAGRELYRLDTDQPGTAPTLVADLLPGSASSNPTNLMGTDTALYFTATTAVGEQFLRYDLASNQLVDMGADWSGFGTGAANRPTNFVFAIT